LNPNRLYFLDAVRAFAILMMLQGHFIDTLIDPIYRNPSSIIYNIWSYFRGITAPVFFTISGLVFSYLLLLAFRKGSDKERIKKGLFRGLLLLIIGYSLRINIVSWFSGYFDRYILVVDVLQCIGLSLIILIGLYVLLKRHTYIFSIVLFTLGFLCFITEPLYRNLNIEGIPEFLVNYITKQNGSVFTILPWFGYTAFGAFLATVFFRHAHRARFKLMTIISFFVIGFVLIEYSSLLLIKLTGITGIELFKQSANFNYLFTRFGNVLVLFGFFYSIEPFLKQPLVLKIGQKTLSIYVFHFIILFGSFTGYGLKRFFAHTLNPTEAILGALIFIILVCFISFYYARTNHFVYNLARKVVDRFKK
jgi:uncharacterized membrane protein